MLVSDELVAEINTGIEQSILKQEGQSEAGQDTPATETNQPAPETVIENDGGLDAQVSAEPDTGDTTPPAEKPDATATAPTVSSISDDAFAEAVRAGLSPADVRSFPNEESLLRVVGAIYRAAEAVLPSATKTEAKDDDLFANLPKLDPETYEPEVIQTIDALKGIIEGQHKAIQAFHVHQEQAARGNQQAAAREVEQWFDKQVESLGTDFEEALGKGGFSALSQGSSQFVKRDQIAGNVAVLLAGYKASGQQPPPREQVFDAAARMVLRDEYQKVYEKKLSGDLTKRSAQHINRTGGHQQKSQSNPLEETAALIDSKFFGK